MSCALVVDDDPISSQVTQAALEASGFGVVVTQDPQTALAAAVQHEVDAVVLDLLMPRWSGIDVLHALRADPRTRDLPVLMLSARGDAGDRVHGLQEGADDYLGKPFDPAELALRLNRLVQTSAVRHSLTGQIESFPLADVLQSLQQSQKSGFLTVTGPTGGARLILHRGTVRSASFGALTGRDAMLALLDLTEGRFEMDARDVAAPAAWTRQDLDIHDVLLEAAWLTDELATHRRHLPSETAPLTLARGGGVLDSNLPALPFTDILTALGTGRAQTLADLLPAVAAAPKRIRLAVAILVRAGVLQ